MGGLFSKPKAPTPPPPPQAPVEEAKLKIGEGGVGDKLKKAKRGKKKLQIGTTTAVGGTGLNTGA